MSRIQNLERYITDDIVRHGNRLNDLEKKIVNAYQELTSAEAIDDDTLFGNEEDEEEESAFVMYAPPSPISAENSANKIVQGPIHRRHWRGLSRPARARNRCRVWSFISFGSETASQGQEEHQTRRNVRVTASIHLTLY